MEIKEIQDILATDVACHFVWPDSLNDTDPGHYGIHEWDVSIYPEHIWIDIPNRSFNFKNVKFSFKLQIGSSSENDGISMNFDRLAKGFGKFEFESTTKKIKIIELNVEYDHCLMND